MVELQRITTQYIDAEDRVRLSGETAEGKTVLLWMTRRLLDRLIPHLALWLEKQYADLPRAEIMLEFAQQKAQSQLVLQTPVMTSGTQGQLIESVDINAGATRLRLNFKTADTSEPSGIGFEATPLRQWLTILQQAYKEAEWPMQCWPGWMEDRNATHMPQAMVLH